jgi:hypothetical protein
VKAIFNKPVATSDSKAETAYLAIPLLDPDKEVVLILYGACNQINFFANDDRIRRVVAMSRGFCNMLDSLEKDHMPNLRNFSLPRKRGVEGVRTLFVSIQEEVPTIAPPQFGALRSFNFDTSPA